VPSGGTAGPLVGDGAAGDRDTDGDETGGADVTDGDPLIGPVGLTGAELAGAAESGARLNCVLAGADGAADCTAPAWLWREQPAAVAASTAVTAAITVSDLVRLTMSPRQGFTSSAAHPIFIVNRRTRAHES
jgi:hypothetical protein